MSSNHRLFNSVFHSSFVGAFVDRLPQTAPQETPVVCSPTISSRVAELCRHKGVGYLDAAGNCHE